MKKYITLAPTLIAATALTVPAFAESSLLPEISDQTVTQLYTESPDGWDKRIGSPTDISADMVGDGYRSGFIRTTGWYYGAGDLHSEDVLFDGVGSDFIYSTDREDESGAFVMAVVELSDLLGENELLTSFEISFNMMAEVDEGSAAGFHAYYVNTTTNEAVEFTDSALILSEEDPSGNPNYSYVWDASNYDMDGLSSDYALIFVWNTNGWGMSNVADLASSYTVTYLPEPSMFGLMFGLGAIGLVATRRRRR